MGRWTRARDGRDVGGGALPRPLVACALLAVALLGCSPEHDPAPVEPSFDFVFAYGVGAKNVLDTEAGTFTKDMVMVPSITVELRLTPAEKERVRRKMEEIGLLDYPSRFRLEGDGTVTPYQTYRFEVRTGSVTKTVEWHDEVVGYAKSERADAMRELIDLVRELIEAKPAYKWLPPAVGAYL